MPAHTSGYNRRALVEANIGRYKRVIGNALRSHTEEFRRAEVAIANHVLNRMSDLGRPKSVRVSNEREWVLHPKSVIPATRYREQ